MMGTGKLRPPLGERAELPDLLALVDAELINVVAYIARRCGDRSLAEDLAADVILRAVLETKRTGIVVTPAWLTTVARNRLVDHWRSSAREERRLRMAWSDPDPDEWLDDGAPLDSHVVNEAMRAIPPMYQAVLSLRYLDDLSVPVVAHELGRSVHSTESLLVRARRAFRASYLEHDGD